MRAHYADVWQAVARAVPDRFAIRTQDDAWTYERFAREAGSLAATLQRQGIRSGDAVAMLLHNRPEFLITLFACLATGITPVPLNFRLRAGEITALLDDSGAEALLYPTSLASVAGPAAAEAADDILLISIPDDETEPLPGTAWADAVAGDEPLPAAAPDDAELWIYTGGTTGRPKAVRWDERDLFVAQMVPTYSLTDVPWPETVDDAARIAADPSTPRIVNLPLAPFMHGTALTTSMNTLTLGGTVLVTSSARLDAEAAVRFANDEGATRIIVAGDAVAIPLVEAANRLGVGLPTVTSVMSSGMRFSPETKRRLHELGDLSIFDLLASTEGGVFAATTTTCVEDLPGRPKLFPTAVVLDDQQREIQDRPGALGVLAQRGALPLGYHRDHEKTRATFPVIGGIRHVVPGDWVRVEDDRHIEFLGRGSGVINTGGEKVYPLDVEEALLTHPAVADVVVLGVPDPRFGEIVTAVVQRAADVTADELMAHVDTMLAGYKRPRHIVFRASLDRTPTGKVDIGRMREEVVADRSAGAVR
ncbi:AMP-binding protein [Microbacterium thalassium]|uniref:Fatty-acyl-CoA synthase n=1 Tax=Microbacterium thalassium TaxID=362649 RepID=A0A7X0KTZ1_9MICO|nr:AMP-binding protein [Microbacterium thalassium]MBB6390617.1 fatty-acyl-CoA synthase [Microbacterium thalassium]GLK25727.1 fatty-acyl-CoA synthase [Microbacterium thalassium]